MASLLIESLLEYKTTQNFLLSQQFTEKPLRVKWIKFKKYDYNKSKNHIIHKKYWLFKRITFCNKYITKKICTMSIKSNMLFLGSLDSSYYKWNKQQINR